MARAILEILGDASSAKREARETSAVYGRLEVDMKQLAVSARTSAAAQVSASVHKTARLRSEIVAYREIGAAARLGSREQIAAAELAARAQARLGKISPQAVISPGGAARIRVLESVKQTEALRAEALAYREVASAAAVGSREQVAAAQLAARAESRLATSLGVSSHEARALSRSAGGLERDIGRASRGALAGSGLFRGLGRSIAFASGGFLAFASAGQFIRTSIDAAKEAQVTQKQLGAQFRASGLDLGVYQKQIDATANRLSLLAGFENDELKAAFVTIFRATGNVSKALRDTGLAADIARAKHIDLSKAATLVAKVEAGNIGLLRRQGVQVAKNATVEQALTIARLKFLGQARAGTTEQERFGAVLHNTEEIIGIGLLPTLNKFLASSSIWLTQMNESGKLQDRVASAAHGVEEVSQDVVKVFRFLNKITGSTSETIKDLGAAFLILEGRAKLIKWGLISSGVKTVGDEAALSAGKVGLLSGRLAGLRKLGPIIIPIALSFIPPDKKGQDALDKAGIGFLGHLPFIGHAEQQVAEAGQRTHDFLFGKPKPVVPKPLRRLNPATRGFVQSTPTNVSGELRFGDPTTAARTVLNQTFEQAKLLNPTITRKTFELGQQVARAYIAGLSKKTKGVTLPSPKAPKGLSLGGQFNIAELKLARAQLTKTSADDKAILQTEAAIVRQQVAGSKTLKDRTALTQKLVGIMGQLKGLSKEASDSFTLPERFSLAAAKAAVTATQKDDLAAARETKAFVSKLIAAGKLRGQALEQAYGDLGAANDQLLAAQKEAAAKTLARIQGRQFKALGLAASGDQLVPNRKSLQKDLGKLSDAVAGTFLDTGKTQSLLTRIRKVLSGGLGALSQDVRSKVKELLDGVDQQLKDHTGDKQTKFRVVSTDKVLAGLGLSAEQMKAARGRLSQLGAGGVVPAKGKTGALGVAVAGGNTYNLYGAQFHGVNDPKALKDALDRYTAQRSPTRRGRNAGR